MSCVRVLCAALLAAATFSCLCERNARADAYRRDDDTFLLFSGTDLWRHGSFSYGGLLWSPGRIERQGFTFKLLIGDGAYRYKSGTLGNINARQVVGFALPGWRFIVDGAIVSVFAGVDVQDHALTPHDPGSSIAGTHVGIRGAVEFWHEPDPQTMIAADASITSIGPSYSLRAAFGWRVFDAFYAGPEVAGFSSDDAYKQFRAGLHLTGFKWNFIEWSAGFGWSTDSDDRDGVYGRIGLFVRR